MNDLSMRPMRSPSRTSQQVLFSAKGSKRWLQIAVNASPESLNRPIRDALTLPSGTPVQWLSPLAADGFVEYRDQAFVHRLGVSLLRRPLADFWPRGGPVWDGLARVGADHVLLIEAKAHVPEMVSGPCSAIAESSRRLIDASLREARRAIAPKASLADWSGLFYQYTNRLAHLYLLRTLNDVPAHLINVYFLNAADVSGPVTRDAWTGAVCLLESYLGVSAHKLGGFVHHVFVDVNDLVIMQGD